MSEAASTGAGFSVIRLLGEADAYTAPRVLLPDDAAPQVHRLFELTGLESLLPVIRSWEEAASRTRTA